MADQREEIVQHYAKRGMDVDYWNRIIPTDPAEVARIYAEVQKEKEDAKRIGKRPLPLVGGLQVYETYLLEENEEPVGS